MPRHRAPALRADAGLRDTRPRPAPRPIRPGWRRLSRQPRRPRSCARQSRQPMPRLAASGRSPGRAAAARLPRPTGCPAGPSRPRV